MAAPVTGLNPVTPAIDSEVTGSVFDIKPFAVHDGPGIRTTVFMKGCSLHCIWCHNPEAMSAKPEIAFYPMRCIACGQCVNACSTGAQQMEKDGHRSLDRTLCAACGECVHVCDAEALHYFGRTMTVDHVMSEIRKDAAYYANSGGGVTVSGGEPLLQAEFVASLLEACKSEEIHTAVDTCGQVPWPAFEAVLPYADLFLYDIKHISPQRHRELTGASNDRILVNLRRLGDRGAPIEIRIPLVPGENDDRIWVEAIGAVLGEVPGIVGIRLLAYHGLAGSKYTSIGRSNTLPETEGPTPEDMRCVAEWLAPFGHPVLGVV